MKVFQELKTAIKEWEDSRSLIISICRELNCSESEIIGKIEQLKTARPANDLNNINEKLEELMEGLDYAKGRAEDVEDKVDSAFSELEYVDADDANDTTSISTETAIKFLFIKNTGYTFSSTSVLGAANTLSVKVMAGTQTISILDTNECIVLKDDNGGLNGTDIHVRTVNTNGSTGTLDSLAVEFLAIK